MTLPAGPVPSARPPAPDFPPHPSDAPRPVAGTRSRSGNAMPRTRRALLDAAEECVERYGVRRMTMADLAGRASVAKATLYNHFRAKPDVLEALVVLRVEETAEQARAVLASDGLPAALAATAAALGSRGAVRALVVQEPEALVALTTHGTTRAWTVARQAVRDLLTAAGVRHDVVATELVLRWCVSHLLAPGDTAEVELGARTLAAGLVPPPGPDPS